VEKRNGKYANMFSANVVLVGKYNLAINPKNGAMIMIQLTDHSSSTDAAVGEVMLKKCGEGAAPI